MEIAFTRTPYCSIRGYNSAGHLKVTTVHIELAFLSHSSGQVLVLDTDLEEIEKLQDQPPHVILLPALDTKETLPAITVLKKILTSSSNDHLE